MKTQKIMNISELKIFEELKDFIYKSDLNIFPQINMKQVITSSQLDLSAKERKTFEKSTFDFVITDNEYAPIFAIEFDGPDHYKYEKTIYSDFRKMSICKKASFPLLRIKYDIYDKFSKITIIKYIIKRYINWQDEKSELEQDFRNKANELRAEGLSDSEIYDYLMVEEPEMEFNFKYYLPEIKNMQKNIYDEFKLLPHYLVDDITHNKISKYCTIVSKKNNPESRSLLGYCEIEIDGYYLEKSVEKYYQKKIISNSVEMHWIISLSDFGIDNYKSVGIECNDYFINEIPGTRIYDLVQMLAEYDCLEKMYVELKTNFKSTFINDQTENIDIYFNENDT